ncbi:MAG TPA: substrate-binding domain-containing protein [Caldimonas sp.]|jgi:putative molybdopterin biosynthesis protein|nr:substrate-binding domain-containing protein [Caldimonas sp.]HEX2539857.1 substrate-binding domain-containing protein [Caldimonas sp.]
MHRIDLTYTLTRRAGGSGRELHHPLLELLEAIHRSGSISAAARAAGLSYRHVWGELKRWEGELGQPLLVWAKGQPARLSPFGARLLWAERQAQARLAPQLAALRGELERAFAMAFDDEAVVVAMAASHDEALPLLRDWLGARDRLHLDIGFTGSVDALAALNDGRCLLAGFHALLPSGRGTPTAKAYRPLLKPGRHKLIGFASRSQGLIVAAGNPLQVQGLADLARPGLRFVNRGRGTGTRLLLEELLGAAGLDAGTIAGIERVEPSHRAVAQTVASGSADVAFGIEAVARARGLDFLPVARESYFLVTLAEHLDRPPLATLRRVLASAEWREALLALPGYEPLRSGEVLSLTEVLPWWRYGPKRR